MKKRFKPGDTKEITLEVAHNDTAIFATGQVHPVYATFAVARDAEWCCRQFVLEMTEEDEEGIGTFISVDHLSPAVVGATVTITAVVQSCSDNEIICRYEARVGERIIAKGRQGQKILKKERIKALFAQAADE